MPSTPIPASFLLKVSERMTEVPPGEIIMRDDRLKKQWIVRIKPFLLSRFPVTQELYAAVMQHNPSAFRGDQLPVETVSWSEAALYCNRISEAAALEQVYVFHHSTDEISFNSHANGYRLPTEAEWEYACKAGSTAIRYGDLEDVAWFKDNSGGSTQPVGQKTPNSLGLYDMLGNVWEWCNDIYDEQVYGSYRVFRGGGWADEARSVMATTRRRSHPLKFKIDDLGFRLARNVA